MKSKNMTISILSLSLLTVMAGAAVAPALNVIKEYFCDVNQVFVQMVISMPALFIVIGNLIFPSLAKRIKSRTLLMIGLALYVVGGCIAGAFSNIFLVLACRALVGLGVGIIMPMSTGLLSFYYTREEQDKLMGYSSAMNQMGGAVATLIAGVLANISWRAAFLVYLMGLISVVLCMLFLPNEYIAEEKSKDEKRESGTFKKYYQFIIAMFLLMFTFFIYPSNFAIETAKEGVIPANFISIIMASMDIVAFFGGLAFVYVKKAIGDNTRIVAPVLFFTGYVLLDLLGGWAGTLIGSVLIGFANGLGIPYIISTAAQKAGRTAGTTVLPLISMALYLGQFTNPFIESALSSFVSPYTLAIVTSVLFAIWSLLVLSKKVTSK